jgi:hypothetical protein
MDSVLSDPNSGGKNFSSKYFVSGQETPGLKKKKNLFFLF